MRIEKKSLSSQQPLLNPVGRNLTQYLFRLISLVLILFMVTVLSISCGSPNYIQSVYYKGSVDIKKSGEEKINTVTSQVKLFKGDKIRSGANSTAILAVSNSTSIRLAEKTVLTVIHIERTEDKYLCNLGLKEGTVWLSQKDFTNFNTQQIKVFTTDNITIELQGGEFDVTFQTNTYLRVFKGKAIIYNFLFDDNKVTVEEGYGCTIIGGDQPPQMPYLINKTGLEGWEQWNSNLNLGGNLLGSKPEVTAPAVLTPVKYTPEDAGK